MDQAKWQDIFNDHQPNACLAIERVPHAFHDNSDLQRLEFLSTPTQIPDFHSLDMLGFNIDISFC